MLISSASCDVLYGRLTPAPIRSPATRVARVGVPHPSLREGASRGSQATTTLAIFKSIVILIKL